MTTDYNGNFNRSSPNKYIDNYFWQGRQRLVEDLVLQSIRMHGMWLRYIPREDFVKDEIFGDDTWSKFNYAFELETYVKSIDSYEGQQDFFSKFSFELKDSIVFTISKRRWEEENTNKLHDENNLPIEFESTPEWTPDSTVTMQIEGENDDYVVGSLKPRPGDLVYFPLVDKIFEINFVEHENLFYQHGVLLTYDLKCELFKYSNEEFDTGDAQIDHIEELFGTNEEVINILAEDGSDIDLENGGTLIMENEVLEEKDPAADNSLFESEGDDYVDFSEKSPFLEITKW